MKRRLYTYLFLLVLLMVSSLMFAAAPDTVAVIPFNDNVISTGEAIALSDILENRLAKFGSFNLVERKAIENIMEELNFSTTDFVDQETAVKAGKMLSSQWLIMGSVSKLGNEYSMNVKLVNTETGRIVTGAYGESKSISGLKDDVESIAKELSQYLFAPFTNGIEFSALTMVYDMEFQSFGAKASFVMKYDELISLGVYGVVLRKNIDGEFGFDLGGKVIFGDPRKQALSLSIGALPSIGVYFRNITLDFYPTMLLGVEDSFGISVGVMLEQ